MEQRMDRLEQTQDNLGRRIAGIEEKLHQFELTSVTTKAELKELMSFAVDKGNDKMVTLITDLKEQMSTQAGQHSERIRALEDQEIKKLAEEAKQAAKDKKATRKHVLFSIIGSIVGLLVGIIVNNLLTVITAIKWGP